MVLDSQAQPSTDLTTPPSFFLDIFSGATFPVSAAVRTLGSDSVEPVDLIFGRHCDLLDAKVFSNVMDLAASGMIGAALAAPYCSKHSMATLRPGGPKPVRTPSALDGLPDNTAQQDFQLQESATIHDCARRILTMVACKGGIIILENPLTSMTFLDPDMVAWIRSTAPYLAAVPACKYGTNWQKSWLFCSNRPDILQLGATCDHDPATHLNFAGLRLEDGTFFSRLTACYPDLLASKLASVVTPFLTQHGLQIPLDKWSYHLSSKFQTQSLINRVEDGGGLISTAVWHSPQAVDHFATLRKAWTTRLFESGLHRQILDRLAQGSSEPPLTIDQLDPFLLDIKQCFALEEPRWAGLLHIESGQPFRLDLWKFLLQCMRDPDADFIDQLKTGVRLGVDFDIPPSPLWPIQQLSTDPEQDLLHCESSWKSAIDQPDVVWPLLEEECRAGFIEKVPGGLDQLQREYPTTAVGKLGLVCAENRAPRLVVDSTVSGVTANTQIPNRMLLPHISDVLQAAPLESSSVQLVALTLDVAKAHRRIKIAPCDGGLLSFWYQNTLFRSKTLNFGARASGYYWSRVAGLMVRCFHNFLHVRHALFQYVDDLLILLEAATSPIWISILTVLCMCLGIPMSWHKTLFGPQVTWIGWNIDVQRWTVSITPDKRNKILQQLDSLLRSSTCDVKLLESITGRLLWV